VCIHALRIQLDGSDWKLKSQDEQFMLDQVDVPGDVMMALKEKNIIQDPLLRYNELDYRYLIEKNWTYSKKFTIDKSIMEQERVEIVFDGIDTICDVFLNENWIGSTVNQFREWRFNVKNFLRADEGNIC
jgi:beta-mannosidase